MCMYVCVCVYIYIRGDVCQYVCTIILAKPVGGFL